MTPAEERFWSKVHKTGGCWLWTAATFKTGYGAIRWDGKAQRAHRIAWRLTGNPDAAELDHICHVRTCVNPAHLRPVTRKQNSENHRGALRNSKSGVRGVHQISNGRWRAELWHNGKKLHIGYFDTPDDAEAAVKTRRNELFTHNDLDRTA